MFAMRRRRNSNCAILKPGSLFCFQKNCFLPSDWSRWSFNKPKVAVEVSFSLIWKASALKKPFFPPLALFFFGKLTVKQGTNFQFGVHNFKKNFFFSKIFF